MKTKHTQIKAINNNHKQQEVLYVCYIVTFHLTELNIHGLSKLAAYHSGKTVKYVAG